MRLSHISILAGGTAPRPEFNTHLVYAIAIIVAGTVALVLTFRPWKGRRLTMVAITLSGMALLSGGVVAVGQMAGGWYKQPAPVSASDEARNACGPYYGLDLNHNPATYNACLRGYRAGLVGEDRSACSLYLVLGQALDDSEYIACSHTYYNLRGRPAAVHVTTDGQTLETVAADHPALGPPQGLCVKRVATAHLAGGSAHFKVTAPLQVGDEVGLC